ncbi:hypothetical protein EDD16DRAFT_1517653, partial [Pisolithus croceorrhizus]
MEHINNASNKQLVDSGARANKRSRSRSESPEDLGQPSKTTLHHLNGPENNTEIYGASHFGEWGEYMQRKRAKLQIQNTSLEGTSDAKSDVFRGLSIYVRLFSLEFGGWFLTIRKINGWTRPSVQELRKLIVTHGGVFQPYLDRKSSVFAFQSPIADAWVVLSIFHRTHIITCSLTPAKIREFKYMKVDAGTLLPWMDYIFHPGGRVETSQGSPVGQTTLKPISKSTPPPSPQVQVNRSEAQSPVSRSRSPPRPLYTTDPSTYEDAVRVPGYAMGRQSNEMAERVMADPQWRAAHTSIAPDFIEGFYKNSRLHHLSMWKAELRNLVLEAQERAEREEFGSTQDRDGPVVREKAGRSVELDDGCQYGRSGIHAEISNQEQGESIKLTTTRESSCIVILTVSSSRRGLLLGHICEENLWSSVTRKEIKVVHRNGMRNLSLQFYTILMRYADDLEAVSVDEALVDVSHAETIRKEVKATTGCEVSIGIAENIQLARIATRKAKPAGLFHLKRDDVQRRKRKLGTANVGELTKKSKGQLCEALGKGTGETLYKAIRGSIDTASLNPTNRAEAFIYRMAEEVARRMSNISVCGRSLTLKIMKRDPSAPKEAPK